MPGILVLYYSSFGHVEKMAQAVARGAAEVDAADVSIKRVAETVPEKTAREAGYKLDQDAPIAKPDELADYDAVIFGTPTRYGMMAAQMRNYLDQTGALWQEGSLIGEVGNVFASTATQHVGAGEHDPAVSHDAAAPRIRDLRAALFGQGPDASGSDHRRLALRRDDDRGG